MNLQIDYVTKDGTPVTTSITPELIKELLEIGFLDPGEILESSRHAILCGELSLQDAKKDLPIVFAFDLSGKTIQERELWFQKIEGELHL